MPADRHDSSAMPPRLALYISALVWPGAGQFVQKRWLAGWFYALAFLVCSVFLTIAIFAPLFWNLRMLAEYSGKTETLNFHPVAFVKIMLWLGLAALVYLASLLDTFLSHKRRQKQQESHADN